MTVLHCDSSASGGALAKSRTIELVDQIFGAKDVTNIGYATRGDFSVLRATFPGVTTVKAGGNHIDMSKGGILKHIAGNDDANKKFPTGLSGLVQFALRCDLPKSNRMTDWERRPLRPEQVHDITTACCARFCCTDPSNRCAEVTYAINDADCLVTIWNQFNVAAVALGSSTK